VNIHCTDAIYDRDSGRVCLPQSLNPDALDEIGETFRSRGYDGRISSVEESRAPGHGCVGALDGLVRLAL